MHKLFWIVGLLFLVSGCSNTDSLLDVSALPEGNVEQGAILFTQSIKGAPACSTCHMLTSEQLVGPGLVDYSERAATEVDGLSAEEYSYNSILHPANHIVSGYSNLMYAQYASKLTNQELADIIAYLLTF
jgi:cytochrome c2